MTTHGDCYSSKPSLKVSGQPALHCKTFSHKGPFWEGQALSSTSLISTGDAEFMNTRLGCHSSSAGVNWLLPHGTKEEVAKKGLFHRIDRRQ